MRSTIPWNMDVPLDNRTLTDKCLPVSASHLVLYWKEVFGSLGRARAPDHVDLLHQRTLAGATLPRSRRRLSPTVVVFPSNSTYVLPVSTCGIELCTASKSKEAVQKLNDCTHPATCTRTKQDSGSTSRTSCKTLPGTERENHVEAFASSPCQQLTEQGSARAQRTTGDTTTATRRNGERPTRETTRR